VSWHILDDLVIVIVTVLNHLAPFWAGLAGNKEDEGHGSRTRSSFLGGVVLLLGGWFGRRTAAALGAKKRPDVGHGVWFSTRLDRGEKEKLSIVKGMNESRRESAPKIEFNRNRRRKQKIRQRPVEEEGLGSTF